MTLRTKDDIKQEIIELLSKEEYILSHLILEIGINTQMAIELLEELDQNGILEKQIKPSFRNNKLCIHYHVSTNQNRG